MNIGSSVWTRRDGNLRFFWVLMGVKLAYHHVYNPGENTSGVLLRNFGGL